LVAQQLFLPSLHRGYCTCHQDNVAAKPTTACCCQACRCTGLVLMLLQLLCLLPLRRCRAVTAHAAGGITAPIAAAADCPYHH
jgi:hypothetical protein